MDTEIIATSYLKEAIATTDRLSPFINEGDKEPSWDGNIYLYSNARKKKAGVKKIPVQVKGAIKDSHPEKITYRMGLDDIDNYLRDGGIILFVVYISKDGKRKRIYYESLLPIRIRILKNQNAGKKTIPVECKPFPTDPEKMVSICMNYYEDMQKQRSFALRELKSIEELEKEGVLEGLTMSVLTFGHQKDDMRSVLLQSTPYLYAKIKGSDAPQPLEMIPMGIQIPEEVKHNISVDGKTYYSSARRITSAERVEYCIGQSFRIIGEGQKFSFNYTITKNLVDAITDIEFMIAFIEHGELQINDITLPAAVANAGWADRLPVLREQLEYYKKVKAILDALKLDPHIIIQKTTDADVRNTERLYRGIVQGKAIENLKADIPIAARMDYYGKKLILAFAKVDDAGTYNVYDFNSAPIWFAYDDKGKQLFTSRYDILDADNYLDFANIDLDRLVESYQELSEYKHIFGCANQTVLKLLSAYDKSNDARADLLQCAYNLASWLVGLDISEEDLSTAIRKINLWQILKRMGKLTEEDQIEIFQFADDASQEEVVRVGAYLVLDNMIAAKAHFNRIPEEQKGLLRDYPIFRYWKTTIAST